MPPWVILLRGALLLESVAKGAAKTEVPTETPPPYFPQNMLSPGDPKTARKMRVMFWGCSVLALLSAVGLVVLVVYLVRSLV